VIHSEPVDRSSYLKCFPLRYNVVERLESEGASLFPGGVQSFVKPCLDQRLAVDAAQLGLAVQHCICLGKSTFTRFSLGCSTCAFFTTNPSDSRSSPASNRSASSSSVLGNVFFIELPVTAARFPNRNDPDIRSPYGRPQVAVTMPRDPRIPDLIAPVALDYNRPH
jgi:hypothetical protein